MVARFWLLRTDTSLVANGTLPEQLNSTETYSTADKDQATFRTIRLEMSRDISSSMDRHSMNSINGSSMEMDVINERVTKGELEVWSITALRMPHPFHIHGVSFQILTHHGKPPAEADRGWKDTVLVGNEPTEVIMRFNYEADEKTPYMYHCHILEHEDGGMMGQFTVQ
jgi:blue copper oxidase